MPQTPNFSHRIKNLVRNLPQICASRRLIMIGSVPRKRAALDWLVVKIRFKIRFTVFICLRNRKVELTMAIYNKNTNMTYIYTIGRK